MSNPTLPLTALWFPRSLVSSSAALSSKVQTAIGSLRTLPEPKEPAAPDSATAWELSSYDWEHEEYIGFRREYLQV